MFARKLSKDSELVAKTSLALLQANVTHATQRLIEMMDEDKPNRTQYNAALSVIKIVYENQMLQDLEARLGDLEKSGSREA